MRPPSPNHVSFMTCVSARNMAYPATHRHSIACRRESQSRDPERAFHRMLKAQRHFLQSLSRLGSPGILEYIAHAIKPLGVMKAFRGNVRFVVGVFALGIGKLAQMGEVVETHIATTGIDTGVRSD